PPGVDPADLAMTEPDRLAKAVDDAVPFLKFRVDRVLGAARLATAEGRARAAEAALEVIREHPSELVRDQYLMEVAGRCRVEPDQLRAALAQPPRRTEERGRDRGRDRTVVVASERRPVGEERN